MTDRAKAIRLYLILAIFGVVLDQLVKWWTRATFSEGQSFGTPWPGVFEFTLVYNRGIAFGLFQGVGAFLTPIALIITFFAFNYVRQHPNEPKMMLISMAMISAGAIGNLIDRLALGMVTDMFWFRAASFPVFNIADAFITIGGILFAIRFVFESRFNPAPEPETPAQLSSSPDSFL